MTFELILLAVVVVIFGALALSSPRRSRRSAPWRAERLAAGSGLALPDHLRAMVERAVARRLTAQTIGGLVGMAIGECLLFATAGERHSYSNAALVGFFAGSAVGIAVATLVQRRPLVDGPRFARSRAIGLDDFLHPLERWAPWIAVPAAATAALVTLDAGTGTGTGTDRSTLVLAPVTLGTALLFEIGARRIVREPQRAASPTDLARDDALRASALRTLAAAPVVSGIFTVFFALLPLTLGAGGPGDLVLLVGSLIGAFAVGLILRRLRTGRHFLLRLWPETAAAGDAMQAAMDAHRPVP